MGMSRRQMRCAAFALGIGLLQAPWPAGGQGPETAAMISEIKNSRGRVEVRTAGGGVWRPAAPLQALRGGDEVRASGDARAVVLLSGGSGSVKVDAAGSPFVVPAPRPGHSKVQKALGLLRSTVTYLSSGPKEAPQAVLATRSASRPPAILSPRNGPVLPASLVFEWLGSRFSRYTVRVSGPTGPVLERAGVTGARFEYPPGAPALTPGVRYTLQVVGGNHPPQEAWFEVLDASRAQSIHRDLADLEQALGPGAPPNTLVALRAGFLANNGLMHDARLAIIAGLTTDPDEPTLHLLLANLYSKTSLPDLAAEAYDEAQFLMARGTAEPPPPKR